MNELGWQTLDQRNKFTMFHHDRNTRFANNINVVIPKPNIETFRNSFMYQGAISWNSLPPHLKNATTHDSFKRMYKKEYLYTPT